MGSRETPLYKAWRPDHGELEGTAGEWGALDVRSAAVCYARDLFRRDPDTRSWPISVCVLDPKGARWYVTVHVVPVPEFEADTPQRSR